MDTANKTCGISSYKISQFSSSQAFMLCWTRALRKIEKTRKQKQQKEHSESVYLRQRYLNFLVVGLSPAGRTKFDKGLPCLAMVINPSVLSWI